MTFSERDNEGGRQQKSYGGTAGRRCNHATNGKPMLLENGILVESEMDWEGTEDQEAWGGVRCLSRKTAKVLARQLPVIRLPKGKNKGGLGGAEGFEV